MSRSEIRFNYNNAKRQAQQLDAVAERLERLSLKTMESSMQSLTSAWKGNNATAYLRKTDILKKDIKKTAASIRQAADEIRRVAKRVYDAEMEALRIASKRDS